jgi:hypothetical protein
MRKHIVLAIISICAVATAFGQLNKGTFAVGSTLQGSYAKDQLNASTNLYNWSTGVNPYAEYFIKDNLSVGFGLGYGINQSRRTFESTMPSIYDTYSTSSIQKYSAHLFLKKYVFITEKLALELQTKWTSYYNEYTTKTEVDNPSLTSNQRTYTTYRNNWNHAAELNLGLTYFFKSRVAVSVHTTIGRFNYNNTSHNINMPSSPQLFFGFGRFF